MLTGVEELHEEHSALVVHVLRHRLPGGGLGVRGGPGGAHVPAAVGAHVGALGDQ